MFSPITGYPNSLESIEEVHQALNEFNQTLVYGT